MHWPFKPRFEIISYFQKSWRHGNRYLCRSRCVTDIKTQTNQHLSIHVKKKMLKTLITTDRKEKGFSINPRPKRAVNTPSFHHAPSSIRIRFMSGYFEKQFCLYFLHFCLR